MIEARVVQGSGLKAACTASDEAAPVRHVQVAHSKIVATGPPEPDGVPCVRVLRTAVDQHQLGRARDSADLRHQVRGPALALRDVGERPGVAELDRIQVEPRRRLGVE